MLSPLAKGARMIVVEELGITFLALVIGFLLAMRFGLPPVVGAILMGAIIGPFGLGFIKQSELITSFSDIGATLLLFVIGIEFSLSRLIRHGVRALILTIVKLSFVFILSYEVSLLFGLEALEAIIVGFLFAITSTTVFSKLVKDEQRIGSDEVMLLLAVLIIEDIIAIFMLTFVSGIPKHANPSMVSLAISITQSLVVLIISYVFIKRYANQLFGYLESTKNEETLLFASFALAALLSLFAHAIGLQASIGAFLAGSIISSLKNFKKVQESIIPFGLFFSSFFFLSTGMFVDVNMLLSNLLLVVILVAISMFAKFWIVANSVSIFEKTSKGTMAGLTMLSVGEFSLLLAKESASFVKFDIIGLTASAVFITSVLSAVFIRNYSVIEKKLTELTLVPAAYKSRKTAQFISAVVKQVEPGGGLFLVFESNFKQLIIFGSILVVWNIGVVSWFQHLSELSVVPDWYISDGLTIRVLLHSLVTVPCILLLYKSIDAILSTIMLAITQNRPRTLSEDKRLAFNGSLFMFMVFLFVALPLVVSLVRLPSIFTHLGILPVIVAIAVFWDSAKIIHIILRGGKRNEETFSLKYHIGKIKSIQRIPPRK